MQSTKVLKVSACLPVPKDIGPSLSLSTDDIAMHFTRLATLPLASIIVEGIGVLEA